MFVFSIISYSNYFFALILIISYFTFKFFLRLFKHRELSSIVTYTDKLITFQNIKLFLRSEFYNYSAIKYFLLNFIVSNNYYLCSITLIEVFMQINYITVIFESEDESQLE